MLHSFLMIAVTLSNLSEKEIVRIFNEFSWFAFSAFFENF